MSFVDLDELIDNIVAATLLGIKPNTLEIWRTQGRGPEFLKLGDSPHSPIRYKRSAVLAWRERRTFKSTSAYTVAAKQNISSPSPVKA